MQRSCGQGCVRPAVYTSRRHHLHHLETILTAFRDRNCCPTVQTTSAADGRMPFKRCSVDKMEVASPRSTFETIRLVRCPYPPPYDNGASNTHVITANDDDCDFDEAANWLELESKKRSVQYHLSKCIEYQTRHEDVAYATPMYDISASFQQHNDSLVRYHDEHMSRDDWRTKVASDMAVSGLLAITHILDLLYENGKRGASIVRDLTIWSLFMSASYAIRTLHYSPPIDTTARAAFVVSSCLALRSTCQLFHIGIRTLAISRCHNIVASLHGRVLAGVVHQHDVDSLHHYWFRGLGLFRVEERGGLHVGLEFGASRGCFVETSLPSPGYVIPED
ncbi:hypothetical protein J3F83DRAFT_725615 [Trichoderma novae-zelandiae]